jgi:preprotein translocase subunit SecF
MLFEILFFISLIVGVYASVFAFFKGFSCGISAKNGVSDVKLPFMPKVVEEKTPQETENERLQRIINQNIENYGTDIPQMDVI